MFIILKSEVTNMKMKKHCSLEANNVRDLHFPKWLYIKPYCKSREKEKYKIFFILYSLNVFYNAQPIIVFSNLYIYHIIILFIMCLIPYVSQILYVHG